VSGKDMPRKSKKYDTLKDINKFMLSPKSKIKTHNEV